MSGAGTSATPSETTSFHKVLDECLPSGHGIGRGYSRGAGSSMEQKSENFSPRVEEMMRRKSQSSSDVESEIEDSKVHWSEVPAHSEEEVNEENRKVYAELANDPQWRHHEYGPFFCELRRDWKLGRKIAEGGQADIFEVIEGDGSVNTKGLLKVFKRGSRLSDLKKQWPDGILRREVVSTIFHGMMLDDGRFAFLLGRCWGDLRKLIDKAMQEKNNQGPPFPYQWNGMTLHAKDIVMRIIVDMMKLHEHNIIHRDLKAANVLLVGEDGVLSMVADYECSIGVLGTGFWRAPELLVAMENKSPFDFTKKVDVYSFGMICFEVVTGRFPFEEFENTQKNILLLQDRGLNYLVIWMWDGRI